MRADLLAGTIHAPAPMTTRLPRILVFDSGVGGLSVFVELAAARPEATFIYAADDAAFPYGRLSENALRARVLSVMERLVSRHDPDLAVIACNTASTLVLPSLRARFAIPFVGAVPAIKPAAEASASRLFTVLATPGTVARDYTQDLLRAYAGECRVTLVGSARLALLAEAELSGAPAPDAEFAAEIAPCFVEEDGRRTDTVVLACTHYPLVRHRLAAVAPWPVNWIDPAPAIARRVTQILGPRTVHDMQGRQEATAVFTGGATLTPSLRRALASRGLRDVTIEAMPLLT